MRAIPPPVLFTQLDTTNERVGIGFGHWDFRRSGAFQQPPLLDINPALATLFDPSQAARALPVRFFLASGT
jgi:hypothetical protein